MIITDLVDRFTFYATDSLDINFDPDSAMPSFLVVSMEGVQIATRNGITFPCLLLQVPLFDKDGQVDNITERVEGSFMVLKPVASQDIAGRLAVFAECKSICDQITNHMIQDTDLIFDGGQVKTSEGEVGPVIDGIYGWSVNFGVEMGYDGRIDPARWRTV